MDIYSGAGSSTNVMPQYSTDAGGVIGDACDIKYSNNSLAVGDGNQIGSNGNRCTSALAVGLDNTIEADEAISMGYNTQVLKERSMGAGSGIIVPNDGSAGTVIVGRYNDTTEYGTNDVVFGVGNGDAVNSSNAITIYADGSIVIQPQGDVLMGDFDN